MSFSFKQFHIDDSHCGMKISTDGVLLGAWADCSDAGSVADVGAGSGLIAVMLAQRFTIPCITAVEIDRDACIDASLNVSKSPWSHRINVQCCDFNNWLPDKPVDAIVSNPPFFTEDLHSPSRSRALARHADKGLSFNSILSRASDILSPTGTISLILPAELEDEVIFKAELSHLKPYRLCHVFSRPGKKALRFLVELGFTDKACEFTSLYIRDNDGAFSKDYIRLTRDFYLDF